VLRLVLLLLNLFDCFTDKKSACSYTVIPNKVPLNEINKSFSQLKGQALFYTRQSANEVFNEVDGAKDGAMNKILWFAAKGMEKYRGTFFPKKRVKSNRFSISITSIKDRILNNQ